MNISVFVRTVFFVVLIIGAGCSTSKEYDIGEEGVSYELTYENCLAMKNDPEHYFWKSVIAVHGCQGLLEEAEYGNGSELPPKDPNVDPVPVPQSEK